MRKKLIKTQAVLVLIALASVSGQVASRRELGPVPIVPESPATEPGAVDPRAPYSNPTWINTADRAVVKNAYDTIFATSSPAAVNWTGYVTPLPGVPGTTSQTYRDAALTRINWFRAMAGVPADIQFDSTYSSKAQQAALMMSSNNQLSHSPPIGWVNYTAEGAEAAGKSNLCLGYSYPQEMLSRDPGCVAGYMEDDGANNTAVGHRRWLLVPQTRFMGTGDVTQTPMGVAPTYWSANAIWVQDGRLFNTRPATRDTFVAWPNKGYVPYQVVPQRWSVSYGSANFTLANVTMTVNGSNVPLTKLPVQPGSGFIGENTLVWQPSTDFSVQPASDTTVTVSVTGITGYPGGSSITYDVIVFNPAQASSLLSPTLVSPANGATNIALTGTSLNWNTADGAASYDVYFGTTNPPPLTGNTTSTTSALGTLTASTTYYWKIVARNGGQTAPSATWSFTTVAGAPGAPALVSPADGATGLATSTTLNWNTASDATSYDVYFGTTNPPPFAANTTNLSYAPVLANGVTYYWRVVAKNAAGNTTSPTRSFTTVSGAPSSPTLTSPANGATNVGIDATLNWLTASGATSYDVYFGTAASPPFAGNVTGLSYTPLLAAGTTYYWRVVGKNAGGGTTSATFSFSTLAAPGLFTLQSPANGATGVTASGVQLLWSASTNAASYDVYFGVPNQSAFLGNVTGTAINVAATLNASTTYNWYVVAKNAGGSRTSSTFSFTTAAVQQPGPSAPTLVFPQNAATGVPLNASISWNASAGATSYDVYFGTAASPPLVFNTTALNYTPAGLAYSTTYYWKIVAVNGNGTASSGIYSFVTTANPAPVAGLRFVPLTPCRLVDTRTAYAGPRTGAFGPPFLSGGVTRTIPIPSSTTCTVPATAKAYVLNLTLDTYENQTGPVDFVTLWPAGEARPGFYTARTTTGGYIANAAIVKAGTNGAINAYSSHNVNVILDINGYFTDDPAAPGLLYYPMNPCRAVDTRGPTYSSLPAPYGNQRMQARENRTFRLPGSPACQIPVAAAYSMQLTLAPGELTNGAPVAFITAYPTGLAQPNISNMNAFFGYAVANSAIVPASANGSIDVYAYDATNLIIDVNGYFAADDGSGRGLYYYPATQCRVLDTQDPSFTGAYGGPALTPTADRIVAVPSGRCGGLPATAKAWAANVSVVPNGAGMAYLSMWPAGTAWPNISQLNAFQGQTIANSGIVPADSNGAIAIRVAGTTHAMLEIAGYFSR